MTVAERAESVSHFIGGREVPSHSGRTFEAIDPSSGEVITQVAFGDPEDVDRAVQAAKAAFKAGVWSRIHPSDRRDLMNRVADVIEENADEIGRVESRDTGKPIAKATSEVRTAASFFRYFGGHAELPNGRTYPAEDGYFLYSIREPYGVVGAIAPWNFPFFLACWKSAPALAVGNSVVLKMAEQSPLSTAYLARLVSQAGIPDGVFNAVHGDGPTTGAALVKHPDVPKLTFTGSTDTGRAVLRAAADHVKSVHLELGGKSANIVFADADRELALAGSMFTAFSNTGQICTSGSRLLVERDKANDFVEELIERARGLRVGDPMDEATELGPLISEEQYGRVMGYIEEGRRAGARLALGGGRSSIDTKRGYYVEPTVFLDVTPDMRIAQDEIFGPVLSVIPFDDEADALRIANSVVYGLATMVWTTDLERAFRMANGLESGIVWTNCAHYLPGYLPYEGHKVSGLGVDGSIDAVETFTHLKTHGLRFARAAR